ncbi:protease inhibitor I42 family protein [Mucilaginibacter sp. OK098]|uniref:protease inhibitor I42 family protein n=1 Tax=Mucilaginibacter sp. OK098 TaxID=1855297 RepID=UPI000920224A|nr:protease inhibitor I42 family protein [Mucilaginibacter sp. OK098]SHM67551.1 Predicted secreted protein [Mucilaginibacter sp. OK098]
MKSKLTFVLISFIAFAVCISACKKGTDNTSRQMVLADDTENGKTINVSAGQSLKLTLGNPGDGGYTFDNPQYNSAVLSLINHVHIAPISGALGDFGKDAWEFKALKSGSSTLSVTATRPFDKANPVVMFSGNVAVN